MSFDGLTQGTTHLEVDGVPVMDLTAYDLRWYGVPADEGVTLYFHGRRVTKPWKLKMDVSRQADEGGASANTA